jgi:urea ABC transporter ATP-binding protein UrtE
MSAHDATVLSVDGLHAGYGPLPVLHDVSFALQKGETLVLLGRNGVGKTTLLRTLIGLIRDRAGRILLDGTDLRGWAPHRRACAGVAYVPQGRGIFPRLSVAENLLVGTRARRDGCSEIPERVLELFPLLRQRLHQTGGTLSGGEQQILALARALCAAPSVLLLDEPSEGIQPSVVQQIGALLRRFNLELGLSVLLVEQNLELARRAATRCLVMSKGRITDALDAADLSNQDEVFRALSL